MFSFFSKKPKVNRLDDKVYMKRIAADAGLLADAKTMSAEGKYIFAVYFFDETFNRLENLKGDLEINFIKAEKILRDLSTRNSLKAKISPVLLFAEHHPSSKTQDAVILELETIFPDNKPSVGFYMGMDESLMIPFGADRIVELMQKMGVTETEAISHAIVTKSIHNAQEKISNKITSELQANSQEEWMKKNFVK